MKDDIPNDEKANEILEQGILMQKEIILNYEMFLEIISKIGDIRLYNSVIAKKEQSESHRETFQKHLLTIKEASKETISAPLSSDNEGIEDIDHTMVVIPTTDVFESLINTPVTYYGSVDGTSVKIETTFLEDGFCHLPQKSDVPDYAKYAYNVLYKASECIQRAATEVKYYLINKYMYDFNNCIREFLTLIGLKENLSINLKNYISQNNFNINDFDTASIIKHILRWTYYVKFNEAIKLQITEDELASIKASMTEQKETELLKRQNTQTEQKETIIIKREDVIVLSGIRACTNKAHKVIEKNAKVLVQKNNGFAFEVVPISYCQECHNYIMLYSDFDQIDGKILCNVRDMRRNSSNNNTYEQQMSYETSESIMHRYGYNVNAASNLSSQERTAILAKLVNNKVLTRSQICSHLEYLIRRNQHKKNMTMAISKWNSDLKFIRKYKPEGDSGIFIKNITIK